MTVLFNRDVIIVTGGGRGMGRAHCLEVARRGARVVVNDIGGSPTGDGGDATVAQTVVDEIRAAGGEAVASTASVATEEGAASIVAQAIETFGRVDAIVHNAGVVGFTPIESITPEDYHRVVSVHLDGGFLLARAAWPTLKAQGYGRLVFITSQTALCGLVNLAHYASAKAGLLGLGRVLAREGADHGIRTNILGVTAMTRLMKDFFGDDRGDRPDVLKGSASWWEHYNRPEMVSPVVAYLVHRDCRLNGELLDTSGGHVVRQFLSTTQGYLNLDLTMEDVAENIDTVIGEEGAHAAFDGADAFLDWRHEKMIARGADLSRMQGRPVS